MIQVTVKNIQNERIGGCEFDTLELANAWIEKRLIHFGKPERWLPDFLEGAETRQVQSNWAEVTEYLHPAEYSIDIIDITEQYNKQQSKELKIAQGKKIRAICEEALDFIAGHNIEVGLSAEQITQLMIDFQPAYQMIVANRPWSAITLISAIDNEAIAELKIELLQILNKVNGEV